MPSVEKHLQDLYKSLEALSDTAYLDAQVLLAHILERPRAWVLAHPEYALTLDQATRLQAGLARVQAGEPLPYVLSRWEFYALQFELTPAVLIPRPETELLVDHALEWLRQYPDRRRAADAGTGSGIIAVVLAYSIPSIQVFASDLSSQALQVAQANAQKHGVQARLHLVQANLLLPFLHPDARFDLVCANLPYIPTATLHSLPVFGREPEQALDGGPLGLDLIQHLLLQAPDCLAPGGLLLLEIEASQGPAASALAWESFPEAEVRVLSDYAGHDRVLRVQT